MCGIAGAICKKNSSIKNAAIKVYEMLLFLQHRGQDSCGIVSIDKQGNFCEIKAKGLLSNLEKKLKLCNGDIAIGHVRYSTSGKSLEAQPIIIKDTAMCHNGNIINRRELRERLKNTKYSNFTTDIDVEELLRFFLFSSKIKNNLKSKLKYVFDNVKGVYSALTIMENKLIAFRDPSGVRPLYYGISKDCVFVASEKIAIEKMEANAREIKQGQCLIVDKKLEFKLIEVEKSHSYNPCIFELIYFANPSSEVFGEYVAEYRERLGKILAEEFKKKFGNKIAIDYVCDVPSTAKTAAISFAKHMGLQYIDGIQRNYYMPRTFILSSQKGRENAVKFKISIDKRLKGKNIVVVDDSIVRGTTSKYLVDQLKKNGVNKIYWLVTSPPIKYPCIYGIDMSLPEELIASNKSVDEIKELIGVDYLLYLPLTRLKDTTKLKSFCDACFSGNYPIKPNKEELEDIIADRKNAKI